MTGGPVLPCCLFCLGLEAGGPCLVGWRSAGSPGEGNARARESELGASTVTALAVVSSSCTRGCWSGIPGTKGEAVRAFWRASCPRDGAAEVTVVVAVAVAVVVVVVYMVMDG